jgi:hypothetical protein
MLEKLAAEALTALETYNYYDIGADKFVHSTDLIFELRKALNHKREPLREPLISELSISMRFENKNARKTN